MERSALIPPCKKASSEIKGAVPQTDTGSEERILSVRETRVKELGKSGKMTPVIR